MMKFGMIGLGKMGMNLVKNAARPVTPASGKPPAIDFAKVVRSGATPGNGSLCPGHGICPGVYCTHDCICMFS